MFKVIQWNEFKEIVSHLQLRVQLKQSFNLKGFLRALSESSSSILWRSLLSLKLAYFSHLCHLSLVEFLIALLEHSFHPELNKSFLSWKSQHWAEKFCLRKCCVSRGWAYCWNLRNNERIPGKDESKSLSTPHTKQAIFISIAATDLHMKYSNDAKVKHWEILRRFLEAIFHQKSVIRKKQSMQPNWILDLIFA